MRDLASLSRSFRSQLVKISVWRTSMICELWFTVGEKSRGAANFGYVVGCGSWKCRQMLSAVLRGTTAASDSAVACCTSRRLPK